MQSRGQAELVRTVLMLRLLLLPALSAARVPRSCLRRAAPRPRWWRRRLSFPPPPPPRDGLTPGPAPAILMMRQGEEEEEEEEVCGRTAAAQSGGTHGPRAPWREKLCL